MANSKTFTASFLKTSISDFTHCCTEPFNCIKKGATASYNMQIIMTKHKL